jgi:hypothetical protein
VPIRATLYPQKLALTSPTRGGRSVQFAFKLTPRRFFNAMLLLIGRISDFHGDENEECRLMGCGDVWAYYRPTFRTNVYPPQCERGQMLDGG